MPHHVPFTDKCHRHSNSSSRPNRKPTGTQARVIKTSNGVDVEEYDDLDGPSLLKRTLGLQNANHSQYVGATRGLEPALSGHISLNGKNEVQLTHGVLRRVSSSDAFLLLPDPETQGYLEELDDLDAIEAIVSPHGKALTDLYFRIVFPSFPVVYKEAYLEKYNRSYREFSPPLLAAVYLLALQYWTYDENLSKATKPNVQELEKLARKSLGDTIHRPKLSTVQAGLLLLQHTDTDSAELTAQLVSVGYGLGLHLDASDWDIPDWEKSLRKRLGWSLYMQDKWTSLGSGRPALINSSNWALQPVMSYDFPETHEDDQEGSSEVVKGRILFSQMISLSEIVADILETLFTVKTTKAIANAGENGLAMILEKAKPVQLRLKEWFANLPECLSMEDTHIMKLSSVGYLRLAYIAAEITLHRRIFLALTPSTNPQLLKICRSVAHERFMFAIDFVQSLKPQHLSSFWYFASPQNFALIGVFGALLLSKASTVEEANFYKNKLREYRWILKINSENGARYMKPALALVDANMALLESTPRLAMPSPNNPSTYQSNDNESAVAAQGNSDDYAFSSSHLSVSSDFALPGQYSFDAPYYSDQHSIATSPTSYPQPSQAQVQDFNFGIGGEAGSWNF